MSRSALHYTYGLMLLLLISCTLPNHIDAQSTLSTQFLGASLLRDADFYGNQDWRNSHSLPRQDIGGRLQLSFRNTSSVNINVRNILINGRSFNQLSTQSTYSPEVSDSKWWRIWPNPVLPGKIATITLRLVNLTSDLPANSSFEIQTDQGNLRYVAPQFNPQPSTLRIVSLNFASDLNMVTLFVANQGSNSITLKTGGGFSINGGAEYTTGTTVAQTTLLPGDIVPITIRNTASALVLGEQAFFRVHAQSGQAAIASLRVFPYQFTIQSQMQGGAFDQIDRQRHFVGDWRPVRSLTDEPMSKGIAPLDLVQEVDKWLNAIDRPLDQRASEAARRQQFMVEIHNTGYTEGLLYDGIADIASTHWGNIRQDLSSYLTAPQPNWYMPQNSWGRNEGLYVQEAWYPLEDLEFQAFQAAGRGAKSIQWFLYQNHWEQGWGRRSGTDLARIYQDKFRSGHIGNPVMWNRIGRISGVLSMLEPYLTNSVYYKSSTTETVSADVVLSSTQVEGSYKAVLTVMDGRTPRTMHAGFLFRYGVPLYSQQILYNQTVRISLPDYAYKTISHAFIVDPWLGVSDLAIRKPTATEIELTVPEVQIGTLIVLGNAADRTFLQNKWNTARTQFASYADGRSSLESQAHAVDQGPWYEPGYNYRQHFTITNTTTQAASVFKLPLNLPIERQFRSSDMRVLEIANQQVTSVPFFFQMPMAYETFTAPQIADRFRTGCIGSASPAGCFYSLEQTTDGLNLISDIHPEGFTWTVSIDQARPWQDSFADSSIPARFNRVRLEVKQSQLPTFVNATLIISFNPDGNPANTKRYGLPLDANADLIEDLGNGWKRYSFDVQRAFNAATMYPGEALRGSYSLALQTSVRAGSTMTDSFAWTVRRIEVSGGDSVTIQPVTALAAGESRSYEVYYDVQENGPDIASAQLTPALANQEAISGIDVRSQTTDLAGININIQGTNIAITTQANSQALIVRHFDVYGMLVADYKPALTNNSANLTLTRPLDEGEMLAVIPVQISGEGGMFVFNAQGVALSGKVPHASVLKAQWLQALEAWRANADRFAPLSMDMSASGQLIAAGGVRVNSNQEDTNAGLVRLLNAQGELIWEKNFPGKLFYVRFAPDGQSLYVAANLSSDGGTFAMYTNSHILKYDLNGTEQWRHKVGSGTGMPVEQQGRTVFDIQVYPNGDLLYSEWNSFAVKLNGSNGRILWSYAIDYGNPVYIPRLVALNDGGAVLLSNTTLCLNQSGTVVSSVLLRDEMPFAVAATDNCGRWALAGTKVRVITKTGDLRTDTPGQQNYAGAGSYIGRSPRTMAFSKDSQYLAAGTSDGIFSLMKADGSVLWQKRDSSSYVTQVAFLPDNKGVVFAREIFSYRQDRALAEESSGWRFRDVVEAYDFSGKALWRHEGTWRTTEPFMIQFVLNAQGTQLTVLSNTDIRSVDLTKSPVSNSYLYPVEEAPEVDVPPIEPTLQEHTFLPVVSNDF